MNDPTADRGPIDRRSLAREISRVESGGPAPALDHLPRSRKIGITGPPGAGKSTLVDGLIREVRSRGLTVAVLAVDPSSPVTGGALLGDRIRMQDHASDPGVFIRSMATRGHLGGLARSAGDVIDLMAASDFDLVLVETVGVGQSEVEVMDHVDVTVLVITPGWGDHIQADKAGVVEVADVFVINKGDRPGVDEVHRALTQAISDSGKPILVTTATTGDGVAEMTDRLLAQSA